LQNDDTCNEYWFEDEYLAYLRANHPNLLEGVQVDGVQPAALAPAVLGAPASTQQNSERMVEMLDIKVQIADLKVDIANLKLKIKDLKNGGLGQPLVVKVDIALVALVMLNLFVTILVATIWK
jgi:flagellar motor switch/type III secretory pathway protein FliN